MAGAGILATGVTEILKKLVSFVANEITLVWDFENELENLQTTLNMILAVMEDAEKRQQSSKTLMLWMKELKAIAYDAEDVLDKYFYEVMRCKREKEEHKSTRFNNKVHNTFSSSKPSFVASLKLAHKIKKINEKFNKIANRNLGLLRMDVGSSSSSSDMNMMMKNRETNSLLVEDWKIVGRENDKSTIIKMLLEEENSSNNQGGVGGKHVSVIPIVGMGGLGKTTMAQQVYNDETIKKHFQLKIWICVSDPFDIKTLYKNIAKSIGITIQYDDATTMDDIACRLQDAFKEKKFILVLDDVWNEKPEYWNNFKKPFMVGRRGSKILVTTRNEKVALIMVDKFQPYPLGILKKNDSWSLFKEIAFGSAAGAEETPKLEKIGKEMVKRCGGLPLAVIFLGSLMRSKKKEDEWEIIRDNKLWHESEILPSLRLSYDYLPSHLKLCFSYCCLYPKDWIIKRETLIRLWMAEGFLIETPGEAMSMEEIGNEYFHSLLSSFFLQDVKRNEDGGIETCKMHDLVHDLARSVVGNHEYLIVENALDIDYISEETRRLNLLVNLNDGKMLQKVVESLKKAKKLRTIIVKQQMSLFDIGNAFKENKRLRVLVIHWHPAIPGSTYFSNVGMKHLRYLDVDGAYFSKGMIGRLSFLQTLSEFKLGDKKKMNAGGIEELECLNDLTGNLTISHLECVTSVTDAFRANLKEKKKLRGLNLTWKGDVDAINNHEDVLEGLRPHPNLRTLEINYFKGSKLPRWIEDSSCLPNLVHLDLPGGIYIEQVAGFGALPSLRSLNLSAFKKVECIGNEFYYSAAGGGTKTTTAIAFPSLKKLNLEFFPSLKEWVVPAVPPPLSTTTGATTSICFPLLEEMIIQSCPLLTTITPTTTIIFPSLKVLILYWIDFRAAKTLVTNHLNSLTSLTLHSIHNLITLPRQGLIENNNTLLSLKIEQCDGFEGFFPPPNKDADDDEEEGGVGQQLQLSSSSSSSSLQFLKLYDCPSLRFYPNIRSLTSLRKLEIQECKESKSLQDELTCLSSSFSSLEHLEHVKILKKSATAYNPEVVFEWRKPSTLSSTSSVYMHTQNMLSFKERLINIGMRCWWFPCSLLGLEGEIWRAESWCWRMLFCLFLWLAAVLCFRAVLC